MKPVKPAVLALLTVMAACGPAHVSNYKPKRREYKPADSAGTFKTSNAPGSLWRSGQPSSMLFTDQRAFRQNDLVVVRVVEIANAKRSAETQLDRQTEMEASVKAFLQRAGLPTPINGEASAGAGSTNRFSGVGSSARTEQLTATVPSLVRDVLPNGNLFIEGHRVVLVNSEEQHFYISGVIRPIDIDQSNTVLSSVVADAEIEFTGRGVLTDNQEPGVVSRFFSWLWPF